MQPSRIASWIARQRSRWSAPGCVVLVAVVVARVDRREPAAVAVQDQTGQDSAARRLRPRLEVDEVTGREGRAPPGDEALRAARTRSAAARRSRAAGRRSGRGRPRRGSLGAREPVARPRRADPARRGGRRRPRPRSAPRIRWRVDLAIASKTPSSSAPAPAAATTRWRDGWISSIGWNPAASIVARNAGLGGGDLGIRRHHVDPLGREQLADRRPGAPPGPSARRRRRRPGPARAGCTRCRRRRPATTGQRQGPPARRRRRGTAAASPSRSRCSAHARDW